MVYIENVIFIGMAKTKKYNKNLCKYRNATSAVSYGALPRTFQSDMANW